ncbi:hypothetical protein HCN51_52550 [Nonomuraea sp. FMUSA5-5]|uniref:Uncharacterized protein n=1 Tax=Nonomuraea composti TaxID=2720023 RepID=A0ABX1BN09_9ACTN|nr:hypothetical protein [Nonomuraea sp. FMUSA5-5]NJP97964.1 hypothetical protein [Nonomuraea sp. FMUSA5-5]
MRGFAALIERVDLARCSRPDTRAALVVSSYLESGYPCTHPQAATVVFDGCRQAYVAAREADPAVGVAREKDGIPDDCLLYLLPSAKQLTAPGWRALLERARGRLYRALARASGVDGPVSFDTPPVSAALMRHEDGRVFVWCVSQAGTEVKAAPAVRSGTLRDEHGAPVSVVELPPYGVRVLEPA